MPFTHPPEFSGLALAFGALVVAYALFVEPLWGKRLYNDLMRDRETGPNGLLRLLGLSVLVWWGITGIAFLAVAVSPGASLEHLGLRIPEEGLAEALGTVAGVAFIMAVVVLLMRVTGVEQRMLKAQGFTAMLPRNARERWIGLGFSVTAGVCEEIIFRGLLIALGVSLGLDIHVAALLSLAIFAVCHLYQGPLGMLQVTLLGGAFTYLYLSTESLLLPIAVHILVDMRVLVFGPRLPEDDERHETGRIGAGSGS